MNQDTIREMALVAYHSRLEADRARREAEERARGEVQRRAYEEDALRLYAVLAHIFGGEERTNGITLDDVPADAFRGRHGAYPTPTVTVCGVRLQYMGPTTLAEVWGCDGCGSLVSERHILRLADFGVVLAEPLVRRECGC